MNKKFKEEYNLPELASQIRKLLVTENIVNIQKCFIYSQYLIYKNKYKVVNNKYQVLVDGNEKSNGDKHVYMDEDGNSNKNLFMNADKCMDNVKEEFNNKEKEEISNNDKNSLYGNTEAIDENKENNVNVNIFENKENNINLKNSIENENKENIAENLNCKNLFENKENVNYNNHTENTENHNTNISKNISTDTENHNTNISTNSAANTSTDTDNLNTLTNNTTLEQLKHKYTTLYSKPKEISPLQKKLDLQEIKIIELENKIIKYQILNRSQTHPITNTELLDLKTKIEYNKLEKERLIIKFKNEIIEQEIKYTEKLKKYETLKSTYYNLLIEYEEYKNNIKLQNLKKYNSITNNIKTIQEFINELLKTINNLNLIDIKIQIRNLYSSYINLLKTLNSFKLYQNKNLKTGDAFYDEEINNLLNCCETLTQENIKLNINLNKYKNIIKIKENEIIKIKNYNKPINYLEEINNLKINNNKLFNDIEKLILEKNKLIRINVERIKFIEMYKDEILNQNVKILSLENLVEEIKNIKINTNVVDTKSDNNGLVCRLCEDRDVNVCIVSCMHTFCDECVGIRIKMRDRKCPVCGKGFQPVEVKKIYF